MKLITGDGREWVATGADDCARLCADADELLRGDTCAMMRCRAFEVRGPDPARDPHRLFALQQIRALQAIIGPQLDARLDAHVRRGGR